MLLSLINCQLAPPAWVMPLILGAIVWGCLGRGAMLLTEPEPNRTLPAYEKERRFARASLAAYPFMVILGAVGGVEQSLSEITLVSSGVRTVLMCIVAWSLGRFGRVMAERLAEPTLARSAVLVSRAFAGVSAASFVLLLVGSAFLKPATNTGGGFTVTLGGQQYEAAPWLTGIMIVLLLGFLVLAIWALVLPIQFRKRLKFAAEGLGPAYARAKR